MGLHQRGAPPPYPTHPPTALHNHAVPVGDKYLLFGSDAEATRSQFLRFFSQASVRLGRLLPAYLAPEAASPHTAVGGVHSNRRLCLWPRSDGQHVQLVRWESPNRQRTTKRGCG